VGDGDYLALDLGQKRTGIARASAVARLPEPLKVVETDALLDELKKISSEQAIVGVVIGLPRNLDGNDTDQTRWVRQWVVEAKKDIDLSFHFQDEALTTSEAMTRQPNNLHHDAEAAAIILKDFLDGKTS
jgi:putative Holliday junction resolvase